MSSIYSPLVSFLANSGSESWHPWTSYIVCRVVVRKSSRIGGARLVNRFGKKIGRASTVWSFLAVGFCGSIAMRVFEGTQPCINTIIREFENEKHLWGLAGARSLRTLAQAEEIV
ncbi:hypothetical protein PR202_gb13623 [Eleusine coracana subsp. coracana]|uniref:Uncharacterized protein n=1 Tax=Eleusine coracana subsp. coracana TaxID=191504 RepID=A0AAV5EQV0_ELECO|nr:hypothetical protein PR202_gb13623 [Eleusine coracana subsp. coracana]